MPSKTWLVGLDGSSVGYHALRLATMLMDPWNDFIKVFHITDPTADPGVGEAMMANAEVELRRAQVRRSSWSIVQEDLREGWTLIGQIIYDSNHLNNGAAILVIGAAGKTAEGANNGRPPSRAKGNPPMGKVAEACLTKCKVPVLLVRGTTKALQPQSEGLAAERRGESGPGIGIAVCVDGTNVSKKAFDLGLSMCRPGDRLTACHVDSNDHVGSMPEALKVLAGYYDSECEKAATIMDDVGARFRMLPKPAKDSIKQVILDAIAPSDIVVIGSMELSNFEKKIHLGSIAQAVARQGTPHVLVVKRYATA